MKDEQHNYLGWGKAAIRALHDSQVAASIPTNYFAAGRINKSTTRLTTGVMYLNADLKQKISSV